VTLRDNTERPETVDAGANVLAGTKPEKIFAAVERTMEIPRAWNNSFGNKDAAYRVIDFCRKRGKLK
jgi:UDP-N-acetylglucosamine 2-epimerase (non-hydrolysing)